MFKPKTIIVDNNKLIRMPSNEVLFPLSKEDCEIASYLMDHLVISQDEEKNKEFNLRPGVGIAAIQLGIAKKMFAVNFEDDRLYQYVLINPKIIAHSVKKAYLKDGEGCLSVEGDREGFVVRHHTVTIKGYDFMSKSQVTLKLKGYPSIVFQHEYDHLEGKLYYDHINKKDPFMAVENAIII